MTFAQDAFLSFLSNAWKLMGDISEFNEVKRMGPEELKQWRAKEVAKLHAQAVELSAHMSDRDLEKQRETREDASRKYEVLLRGRRGIAMNQCLLEGMDVRGLDLSKFVPGHIKQEHMNHAVGDENTKLPSDLKVPAAWRRRG